MIMSIIKKILSLKLFNYMMFNFYKMVFSTLTLMSQNQILETLIYIENISKT